MNSGQLNSCWQAKVKRLLSQGYGVEDIALKIGGSADDVRNEVVILRTEGELLRLFQA